MPLSSEISGDEICNEKGGAYMMMTRVSNQELDANLKRLVVRERQLLHVILEHINEVDSRKLYLEMAYSSLYEYLVQECKYSGSAAMRRISAARLLREVPTMAEKIQSGSLNLSQVSELSRAIKEKEKTGAVVSLQTKTALVAVIAGKSAGESQKEIAQGLDLKLRVPEKTSVQKDESVHLELTLSQKQYQNLLQCRDLTAHVLLTENQDVSLASVIGLLAEQFLGAKNQLGEKARNVPQDGNVRGDSSNLQETKMAEKALKLEGCKLSNSSQAIKQPTPAKLNKTLTPKTRQTVLARDKCCQFRDPKTGKICGSTFNLQTDHKQSRWANGSHALGNLQILCRSHNNYKYKKEINLRLF